MALEREVTVPLKTTLMFGQFEGFHYADTGLCNFTTAVLGALSLALLPKRTIGVATVKQRFNLLLLDWQTIETLNIVRTIPSSHTCGERSQITCPEPAEG